jgi:hypothetical protein
MRRRFNDLRMFCGALNDPAQYRLLEQGYDLIALRDGAESALTPSRS